MRSFIVSLTLAVVMCGAGAAVQSQAPAATPNSPSVEQMRSAVSRLRGNRIAVLTSYDALTAEQQAYVRSILTGPRPDIRGPLGVMMVSPGLGDLTQKAMAYARFSGREGFGSVAPKLNELAILMVAKHWSANYVWHAHHAFAVQSGLPQEVVDAVVAGRRPARMERDVEAVYSFCHDFLTTRTVSHATLQAAKAVLGVVDLIQTMGLYQITAMMVMVDRTPLAERVKPYFP